MISAMAEERQIQGDKGRRETDTEKKRHIAIWRHIERQRKKDRKTKRQKDRETEKHRDRARDRNKKAETEKQACFPSLSVTNTLSDSRSERVGPEN